MENNTVSEKSKKGFKAFETIYYIGIIFAVLRLVEYFKWTLQLVKKWSLPEAPFFSKITLTNTNAEVSIITYLIFAIAYMFIFCFILLGLYQLKESIKLFENNTIFKNEISNSFLKAGKSFFIFAFGTFIIDIALLFCIMGGIPVIDLMSTELVVFVILGYLMYFLSDVFKKGVMIKEENDLTI
ncbi:hypothetical protein BXQ17_11645 [Polaribacter sp. BM10]|uniref:DUF2975 domain-containing protein n=1 Tax=Polaribacter sp. BM10 TaxID=1529069 RepID=UPI000989B2B4|nr:DUF2975 domain-containing protein [Polaribacter sp. BM10]AQS94685.1 hypothetical protein BXQ17_11645 [Polaribacter sp. BM10]